MQTPITWQHTIPISIATRYFWATMPSSILYALSVSASCDIYGSQNSDLTRSLERIYDLIVCGKRVIRVISLDWKQSWLTFQLYQYQCRLAKCWSQDSCLSSNMGWTFAISSQNLKDQKPCMAHQRMFRLLSSDQTKLMAANKHYTPNLIQKKIRLECEKDHSSGIFFAYTHIIYRVSYIAWKAF